MLVEAERGLDAQFDAGSALRRIVDLMAAAGGGAEFGRGEPVDLLLAVPADQPFQHAGKLRTVDVGERSEEHTSELQSLMRISYAVFCLKKKNRSTQPHTT